MIICRSKWIFSRTWKKKWKSCFGCFKSGPDRQNSQKTIPLTQNSRFLCIPILLPWTYTPSKQPWGLPLQWELNYTFPVLTHRFFGKFPVRLLVPTPFQKAQMTADLYYLKEQPGLNDDGDLVLSGVPAGDAPEKRISHGTCALHRLLQPRLLPDGTRTNPPGTKNTPGFLKIKNKTSH